MRRERVNVDKLLPRQRTYLLTGRDWDFLDHELGRHGNGGFPDERASKLAWGTHRDALLSFWVQDPGAWSGERSLGNPAPGGAGSRPWAFWHFDAKVPRVVIEQLEPARKNELRALGWFAEPAWRAFFGRPAGDYAETESEASYLSRHKFFLEGEATAIQGPPEPTLVE